MPRLPLFAIPFVVVLAVAACDRASTPAAVATAPVDAPAVAPAETPAVAAPTVEFIRMDDAWMGLGGPDKLRTVIVPTPSGDYSRVGRHVWFDAAAGVTRKARVAPAPVPREAVQALVDAISAPAMPRADFLATLTDPAWLAEHATTAFDALPARSPPCPAPARALFAQRFADVENVRAALATAYHSRHTDDYPSLVVTVGFSDKTSRKLTSAVQADGMLPFSETGKADAWQPAIPAALAALMPPESPNLARLRGRPLETRVAQAVLDSIDTATWQEACP